MSRPFSFPIVFLIILILFSLLIIMPSPAFGAKSYYYLHVSSFQKKNSATEDVERLKKKGYATVANREKIPNKGYWYRVYVGPFSTHMEAHLKAKELRSKKIVDYFAIQKKGAPIGGTSVTASKKSTTTSQPIKSTSKVVAPKKKKTKPPEKPVEVSSTKSSTSKSSKQKEPQKTEKKKSKKHFGLDKDGNGRNMEGGAFALGFRYAYQEVKPDLTKRTLTTSDGVTQNVPITGTENERTTSMHIPALYFRWGLTDWFELFAGGGVAYEEFSDYNPAYGGGLRFNIFDAGGFYGVLQGEYNVGTVEYDYDSVTGSKWHKEAEWTEIFAKGELGLARTSFSVYVGGSYLDYQEETERQLLTNIPAPYTSYVFNDELEETGFGAFGGVVFNLSPSFLLSIEGQGINKKGVFGSIEYKF